MIKYCRIAAAAPLVLLLSVLTGPPAVAALGPGRVQNSTSSPYAINAYTGSRCDGVHYVIKPGDQRQIPRINSVRVNALSKHERINLPDKSGPYTRLLQRNECVSIDWRYDITWVQVWKNV